MLHFVMVLLLQQLLHGEAAVAAERPDAMLQHSR
jgi:hypothetical protein